MRISLADAEQQRRLVGFLVFDDTAIVTPVGDRAVEVSFLGSLNAWAQRRELELRLRSWLAAHPGVVAVIND